jgi:hypothetical protein
MLRRRNTTSLELMLFRHISLLNRYTATIEERLAG